MYKYQLLLPFLTLLIFACKQEKTHSDKTLFRSIPASQTGIQFTNTLQETWFNNYYNYGYFYNGGGVAAGDLNNDGLPEVFFTANQGINKLYLNKGNLQFEDITNKAGVAGDDRWDTGVTMADVNGDGWLDIYVCASGKERPNRRKNKLYINNQNLTFTEQASVYKLDDEGYSTQAAFFDYDRDGDLDCYLLNHPIEFDIANNFLAAETKQPDQFESDKLYRNDGASFTDVTIEAGIRNYGYGLGLVVSDFNKDNWPDVYVGNDFNTPDFLYINGQDGTFKNQVDKALKHTANFGMGCDAADFNNDTWPDLIELDMMPEDNRRRKISMPGMGTHAFQNTVDNGFGYQYMQNALQLNIPLATHNSTVKEVAFAEIAELAGVARTDWSWSPLLADFDNDGWKDLYITNGMRREVNNNDFTFYFREKRASGKVEPTEYFKELNKMPVERVNKYAFRNQGNLTFANATTTWGLDNFSFSNGAAYTDLDRDGDLDLVINNLDTLAAVYENQSKPDKKRNFLQIQCKGTGKNPFGIGAKVSLLANGQTYYGEIMTTRGFLSSVEPVLHIGVGEAEKIAEVKVAWPSGKQTVMKDVTAGKQLVVDEKESILPENESTIGTAPWFTEITDQISIPFRHQENPYNDFAHEPLLPHKLSTQGPCLTAGDVNGDGLSDFYIGGAAGQSGALYIQMPNSNFTPATAQPWQQDKASEDTGAALFDADTDGDLDLYVVSGGNEFAANSPHLQDRLYLNNGKGIFRKVEQALPEEATSGSCVVPADFDRDGDMDVFVGGRIIPGKYPLPPRSYLLKNENGKFTDVTAQLAPGLAEAGLVTSAIWTDFNGDKILDLIVAGEWMPITFFKNTNGTFATWNADKGIIAQQPAAHDVQNNQTFTQSLTHSFGWWHSLAAADIDKDGDTDYVAGNIGLNYPYKASAQEPFHVFTRDFDQNGSLDAVLAYYQKGKLYPWRGRHALVDQMPFIRKKYPDYTSFSIATMQAIFDQQALDNSLHYVATTFASGLIINEGNGKFRLAPLPMPAQLSMINSLMVDDFNGDTFADILLAGNMYHTESETRRNDAGYGLVLQGNGKGEFMPLPFSQSGFAASGDIRAMAQLQAAQGKLVLVAANNAPIQIFNSLKAENSLAGIDTLKTPKPDTNLPGAYVENK